MAGALAELPDESLCSAISIMDQTPWRVDYARFFTTPLTTSCSGQLKLSSRKRKISRGTWLLASDYASVFILSDCLATLVILVRGKIYFTKRIMLEFCTNFEASFLALKNSCGGLTREIFLIHFKGRTLLAAILVDLISSSLRFTDTENFQASCIVWNEKIHRSGIHTYLSLFCSFYREEHFLANLNFSWPHVSCSPNSPHWGSRVIFASYKDGCGLIQKFALRFAEVSKAKKFLDAIKESSRDAIDISGKDDVDTQTTSGFENIAPCEHLYRTDEVSSHAAPDGFYRPATPVCSEELECSQTANHVNGFYPVGPSSLPPSFTSLLSECATDHLQGSAGVPENERMDMKENTPMVEESDLASQIRNFMLDASFHGM